MSITDPTLRLPGADGAGPRTRSRTSRIARIRLGVAAAASGGLVASAALALAVPAGAGTISASTGGSTIVHGSPAIRALSLRAMPAGTVTLRANSHGYLTVHPDMFGFTPGSSHDVDLLIPGRSGTIRFSPLTAGSAGQADTTLRSNFTGHLTHGSRLVVRMGAGGGRVASEPIAETGPLGGPGVAHGLIPVEVSPEGVSTPWGRATISYSPGRRTLTVAVDARGFTPGPHAAHIHLGSCTSQGPVRYMLQDLVANDRGVVHAVRVFRHVTAPVPARRWYLNIHEGNSKNILSKGQPTILFRPLLCANI